ncbi:hypothetical protein [Xenorhabdus bovienii]|nr:hypothetical protein [Xenorhabdus bovienii]
MQKGELSNLIISDEHIMITPEQLKREHKKVWGIYVAKQLKKPL